MVGPEKSPDAAGVRETEADGGIEAGIDGLVGIQKPRRMG
jgi:hypothetical protein